MHQTYTVAIAGSTKHTRLCAQALFAHSSFEVSCIITPTPKPIGRTQEITPNPLHQFATENHLPVVLIERKIDEVVESAVRQFDRPDFLLVVDFGYIVPTWMLAWPKIAPLNIHPSVLPRWRGSSPGQFVLLYGETESAVSVIMMNDKLDQGAIFAQLPFKIDPNWTQTEYYAHSFNLVAAELPTILERVATSAITPQIQPIDSPTPIAGRLDKEESFIPWEVVQKALHGDTTEIGLSPLLRAAYEHHHSLAKMLYHATRAFQPWPGLWTLIPTAKGEKRMKILETTLMNNALELQKVQVEGKLPTTWNEIKNTVKN